MSLTHPTSKRGVLNGIRVRIERRHGVSVRVKMVGARNDQYNCNS
jgi:hypothetical protein